MNIRPEPETENDIIEFWREAGIPLRSMRRGDKPFVFFEGPPTANGKPGIHHVAARAFKDLYPRYKTMRGFRVLRRAGWDTHGLPVEVEIEKKIGSKGKQDIEKLGIAEFNRLCKESVFSYIRDWNQLTERIGYWLDLDNAYITYTNDYIESCWWILKDLWSRGFLYESYKTTMHCPRCNTSLADHEVSLGMRDDVDDASIWPKFVANADDLRQRGIVADGAVSFLAWTTTPWTLPANVALCVKPGASYALVEAAPSAGDKSGALELYLLAEATVAATFGDDPHTVLKVFPAEELLGVRYEPLLRGYVPEGTDLANAWHVIGDDFVTLEDGTGIVHIAPAYGDLEYGQKYALPTIFSVDLTGMLYPQVTLLAASAPFPRVFFKQADPLITDALMQRGRMYRAGRLVHAYPFCWRDDTPLLFYAKNSWYIRTTSIRDELLRNNSRINWIPPTIGTGRFGKWLENNIDWALSRERYWGCPLPIWQSDDGSKLCVGSVGELSELSSRDLGDLDLHRPYVDDVVFEKDGKMFRRVPYTIDVWFESGAMPYAQWHFPFENRDEFFQNFPADYICEALDQTRGWFYTLHVLGTLLTKHESDGLPAGPLADRFPETSAFRNCLVLGLLTDREGKKMSKSRGNVVDPWSVLDTQGADALRWYLYSSGPPDQSKAFDTAKVEEVRRIFFMTLRNTLGFFQLYAAIDRPDLSVSVAVEERPDIDRWLLADLQRLIAQVSDALEAYDAFTASRAIQSFVINHLSNWYVRLNRRRFWKSDDDRDKLSAYLTLNEALTTVAKLVAPMAPFIAEELYRKLVVPNDAGAPESVHLADWPGLDAAKADYALIRSMDLALRIVELGRAARSAAKIRTRQPLPELIVRVGSEVDRVAARRFEDLILRELNIKKLMLLEVNTRFTSYLIRPNFPVVGKVLGKDTPKLKALLETTDGHEIVENVHRGLPTIVNLDGREISLEPDMLVIAVQSPAGFTAVEEGDLMVAIRTELTPELIAEGQTRELVRHIQEARKSSGLAITDRVRLHVASAPELKSALESHSDYIADEVLAVSIDMNLESGEVREVEIDGQVVRFSIERT